MSFTLDTVKKCVQLLEASISENRDRLSDLDAPPGDGDHGINVGAAMKRLVRRSQTRDYADLGAFYRDMALNVMDAVGGYSGPLYGVLFMKMAQLCEGKHELSMRELADFMREGLASLKRLGRSDVGDKTMVDALEPAIEALSSHADEGDASALAAAAEAAKIGMESTEAMPSKRGTASAQGDLTIGRIDPGAMTSYLLVCAMRDAI